MSARPPKPFLASFLGFATTFLSSSASPSHFSDTFVVYIPSASPTVGDRLAEKVIFPLGGLVLAGRLPHSCPSKRWKVVRPEVGDKG